MDTKRTKHPYIHPTTREGRHCIRCGCFMSWDEKAVHTGGHNFFSCLDCHPLIFPLFKDYSKSRHGRRRTKAELIRAIRESTKPSDP